MRLAVEVTVRYRLDEYEPVGYTAVAAIPFPILDDEVGNYAAVGLVSSTYLEAAARAAAVFNDQMDRLADGT